jgi:hypothetical protein
MSVHLPVTVIKENGFQAWEFFFARDLLQSCIVKQKRVIQALNKKCIKPGELNQGVISIEKCYRPGNLIYLLRIMAL